MDQTGRTDNHAIPKAKCDPAVKCQNLMSPVFTLCGGYSAISCDTAARLVRGVLMYKW